MTSYSLTFDGGLLKRGFWLYVWEISRPGESSVHYVGMNGDTSSENPQSPFNRMSQHLGANEKAAALRKHLKREKINPEECCFRLVAYGPLLADEHSELYKTRWRIVAALEKALADAMKEAGYKVINSVKSKQPQQPQRFETVRTAFAAEFPKLQSPPAHRRSETVASSDSCANAHAKIHPVTVTRLLAQTLPSAGRPNMPNLVDGSTPSNSESDILKVPA